MHRPVSQTSMAVYRLSYGFIFSQKQTSASLFPRSSEETNAPTVRLQTIRHLWYSLSINFHRKCFELESNGCGGWRSTETMRPPSGLSVSGCKSHDYWQWLHSPRISSRMFTRRTLTQRIHRLGCLLDVWKPDCVNRHFPMAWTHSSVRKNKTRLKVHQLHSYVLFIKEIMINRV